MQAHALAAGWINIAIAAIYNHENIAAVQVSSAAALTALGHDNSQAKSDIVINGGSAALVQSMLIHSRSYEVQVGSCACLSMFCKPAAQL